MHIRVRTIFSRGEFAQVRLISVLAYFQRRRQHDVYVAEQQPVAPTHGAATAYLPYAY